MLKLTSQQKRELLAQPETGMGYQVVDATLYSNATKRGVAYNAELLLYNEEPRILTLSRGTFRKMLESAPSSAGEIKSLRVVPRREFRALSIKKVVGGGAKEAEEEKTKEGEVFKRFVAYENDVRLREDGSWSEGTFATTEEDAKNVKTGKDAVARYALPDPKPASNVFTGRPNKDTVIQRGIVQPAFDQPGGGVEVFFKNGTQPKTVTGPQTIPDE
jgi:hypothetical protein